MIVYNDFSTLKVERRQTVPKRYHSNQELMFPDVSAPGAVFYRVKFIFMGYHPEDGEFVKTFLASRIKAQNQDEAIKIALEQARRKYPQYGFSYQEGGHFGSGAFLVYRNLQHIFIRASNTKEALARTKGEKCFYIQVTPCP